MAPNLADKTHDEQASPSGGQAAGYCWKRNPDGPGRCTRPPHTLGMHVDHYNVRQRITDSRGYTWP